MPCPRCGSTHITEEYKLIVCTDCGNVLDDSRLQAEGPRLGEPLDAPAAHPERKDGIQGRPHDQG